MASALTKPTITLRGMNRMSLATPNQASSIWMTPARRIVATRYPTPNSRDTGATTSATAAVAAVIIAGRPPVKAMVIAIVTVENRPTRGSTPAITENAMASGISANATTNPASTSVRSTAGDRNDGPVEGARNPGTVILMETP